MGFPEGFLSFEFDVFAFRGLLFLSFVVVDYRGWADDFLWFGVMWITWDFWVYGLWVGGEFGLWVVVRLPLVDFVCYGVWVGIS